MKAGTRVRITKVEEEADKIRPDMPPGYWVEGVLCFDLKVGRRLLLARDVCSGAERDGVFETSPVVMIQWQQPVVVTTKNSTYRVEEVANASALGS